MYFKLCLTSLFAYFINDIQTVFVKWYYKKHCFHEIKTHNLLPNLRFGSLLLNSFGCTFMIIRKPLSFCSCHTQNIYAYSIKEQSH